MSNILNQEPQAYGLIKFKTTFGDLEIELFTKQCPKATKNFVQLCLDGYYQGTIFERVEKDFIAIGGSNPNYSDTQSEFFKYYQDEFHSRLRFNRRGLLASANTKKDENGAKFFFTLAPTPELQNKHTIFGRLKGNSVYSLVDLNDCQVDKDYRPYIEQMIVEVTVIDNPWPDLKSNLDNLELLNSIRRKREETSHHDLAYDRFSKLRPNLAKNKKLSFGQDSEGSESEEDDKNSKHENSRAEPQKHVKTVVDEANVKQETSVDQMSPVEVKNHETEVKDEQDEQDEQSRAARDKEKRLREIRAQIQELKEQSTKGLLNSKTLSERRSGDSSSDQVVELNQKSSSTESGVELSNASKKGSRKREQETLELLSRFKKRLKESIKGMKSPMRGSVYAPKVEQLGESMPEELNYLDRVDGDDWLRHKFEAEDEARSHKDADTRSDEWYSIDDSRSREHSHNRHRRAGDRYDHKHRSRSDRESSTPRQRKGDRHHHHR